MDNDITCWDTLDQFAIDLARTSEGKVWRTRLHPYTADRSDGTIEVGPVFEPRPAPGPVVATTAAAAPAQDLATAAASQLVRHPRRTGLGGRAPPGQHDTGRLRALVLMPLEVPGCRPRDRMLLIEDPELMAEGRSWAVEDLRA
jgi:hypothetical protein